MLQEDIYKQFIRQFPQYSKQVTGWFPNGRNSVRVRLYSGSDFIFTYQGNSDWCFETVDSFIRKLKGDKKMC